MIERYTRERMARVWTDENKYRKWLDIEVLICEAYTKLGLIPEEDMKNIREKASFEVARVLEIEERTRHDVVAFIENVAEYVGPSSKYIHMGVTSSDILDTSFSCLLNEAADILIEDVVALMEVLKEKAYACKDMPAIGRTHGIHAEPVTFGLKITHFYDEMKRNLERMTAAKERIRHGKISGAVGTYAHVPPSVEEYVCEKLGLKVCPISSQIIPRDYYAEFFTAIALTGSTIERMSMEVRNLQRTEVGEAEEFFRKGQTGSSAMPHKRNPIASENLCGMARLLHGFAVTAMEYPPVARGGLSLVGGARHGPRRHHRPRLHARKGEERLQEPSSSTPRRCKRTDITRGLYHWRRYSSPIRKGLTRQEAYKVTQGVAMRCYEGGSISVTELKKDASNFGKTPLSERDRRPAPNNHYFRHIETIFKRVYE